MRHDTLIIDLILSCTIEY